MNKSILLATIAVLLVAGCTAQNGIQFPFQQITTTVVGGAGMVISDFAPDQSTVFGGSTDRVMITVKNAGGFDVPDSNSLVFLTGSALSFAGSADTTLYWTSSTSDTAIKHFGTTMKAADIVQGTEGDQKTITWSLKAPNISAQTRGDLFIGRVYYDYETNVAGTVWVYSQSESDAARAAGRTLNKATFSSTAGPVAISSKVIPESLVLASGETFTLQFKVSSIGGGTLYKNGIIPYTTAATGDDLQLSDTQLNHVFITVNAPGMTIVNPTECTGDQELIGGKDITLTCTMSVSSLPATFQGFPITITADYGYFSERTASVTVQKR